VAAARVAQAPDVLVTAPDRDQFALDALASMGASIETVADVAAPASDLASLRAHIFSADRPPLRERHGDVRLFSAPGEGREAVEIVRRILDEAAQGVRFDEMAVFLRTPRQYLGLLEHAGARADVPMYFDRGTRRPDPAGRAFIALLSCAAEGLSARRFDEYLSLGQVPQMGVVPQTRPAVPRDEAVATQLANYVMLESVPTGSEKDYEDGQPGAIAETTPDSDDEAVVAGTLRPPW